MILFFSFSSSTSIFLLAELFDELVQFGLLLSHLFNEHVEILLSFVNVELLLVQFKLALVVCPPLCEVGFRDNGTGTLILNMAFLEQTPGICAQS